MRFGAVLFTLLFAAPVLADETEPDKSAAPKREPLHLTFDWTLGFGKVDVVDQRANPASNQRAPTPVRTQAQVGLNTFIVGAGYDVTKDFTAGIRLPFTFGSMANIAYEGGRAIALGNLEIYGELRKKFSEHFTGAGFLAIGLPTSLGTELPTQAELDKIPPELYNPSDANKFAINQAAAAAFGYEQDQLFWSRRLVFTPGVEGRWVSGKLHATPFVKMVNLIDTHDVSPERYRMELVFGAGAGYRALEFLDFSVRVWGSVAPVRRDGSPVGAGVVSPEARLLFGERKEHSFYVAGVLPFVGSNVDPYYFGAVRAGVAGTF
jgi:hypothetical protein